MQASAFQTLRAVLCLLCALLAFDHPDALAASADILTVNTGQFLASDATVLPPADAGWQRVSLPHRSVKPNGADLIAYWYKASINVRDRNRPLWLLLPMLRAGGRIFVNGVQIGEIRSADAATQVRWYRPHLFFIPPSVLARGDNEIAFNFSLREPRTSFGNFEVGPEKLLRARYERLLFWENTSTDISSMICLLIGCFALAFWLRRQQEGVYGLFGICLVFWGLRTIIFRLPEVPMDSWVLWRTLYYFTTAGFIVCFTIFLLQYSEAGAPSVRKSIMSRLMLVSWLSGSLLFLLVGVSLREVMDSVWILSFLPFTLYAFLRLCLKAWRTRTPSSVAMVMAILLAIGLAIHDYAAQQSLFGMSELYLLHLGIPAFLVVMGSVLLDRFIDSLHQAETSNEQLAERVAVRERELMHSHEQLRKLEREYATTEERQRIMQDMHDGVGSHLLSTLALVQRGNATAAHMETMLKECLDDMRLVIDASSPSEPDLLPVLGNLRFRMEARFRDLGLAFEWRNRDLPDSLEINPHAGLQVLRILQEALTNILKHARASRILVDLQFSADTLLVALEDDGVGFDEAMPASGYGLGNMRMRAGRIGADLHIAAQAHGTRLTLTVPLSGIVNVNLPASN